MGKRNSNFLIAECNDWYGKRSGSCLQDVYCVPLILGGSYSVRNSTQIGMIRMSSDRHTSWRICIELQFGLMD